VENKHIDMSTKEEINLEKLDYEVARLTARAIVNDKCLNYLYKQKLKFYSSLSLKFRVGKDGEFIYDPFDEKNYPQLVEINQAIEYRTQQIKKFFH
jgi:hypothetical protein